MKIFHLRVDVRVTCLLKQRGLLSDYVYTSSLSCFDQMLHCIVESRIDVENKRTNTNLIINLSVKCYLVNRYMRKLFVCLFILRKKITNNQRKRNMSEREKEKTPSYAFISCLLLRQNVTDLSQLFALINKCKLRYSLEVRLFSSYSFLACAKKKRKNGKLQMKNVMR